MVDISSKLCYIQHMTKQEAKRIFGTVSALADALGMNRQAYYQWPEVLTKRIEDRVIGAAVRLGRTENGKVKKK